MLTKTKSLHYLEDKLHVSHSNFLCAYFAVWLVEVILN